MTAKTRRDHEYAVSRDRGANNKDYLGCDPPLEGKHGSLHVNTNNRLVLQHEDETPFFGIGPNMADVIHHRSVLPFGDPSRYYQRDMTVMKQSMDQLHEVGGNFMRMMHTQDHFAHEAVNLGVYDRYQGIQTCLVGAYTNRKGDGQHQSWSFDQLLEHAAEKNIYIQLCVEPTQPSFGSDHLWGSTPYVTQFLNTARNEENGRYSLMNFFYKNGDPSTRDAVNTSVERNVFYFWKRKYKYLMNRWGYSPNLAIIEPFNEIDQMLGYYRLHDLRNRSDICSLNWHEWPVEEHLPETLDVWLTDINDYVTEEVNPNDPVASPLGENKLFLMSYAWNDPERENYATFYKPFYNEKVDLMDAHHYLGSYLTDANHPDGRLNNMVKNANGFIDRTFNANFPAKPFNTGEFNYNTNPDDVFDWELEKYFMNYDVSFHNEIWAGAFSGKWATGTSWQWERVFWWPDALTPAPDDELNIYQPEDYSNVLGESNTLDIGTNGNHISKVIVNRRLHHHFRPLADLLSHPSWQPYNFFNWDYAAHKVFDVSENNPDELEAYYLKDLSNALAIGWVHNRNAWGMNAYYHDYGQKNFLGCNPPSADIITLTGFQPVTSYTITWFSTRTNSTVYPPQMEVSSDNTGDLVLDLTGHFGGVSDNYLDTLRSDYAFVITTAPFTKSRLHDLSAELPIENVWDFAMYPNPTRDEVYLKVPGDEPKVIILQDLSGRQLHTWGSTTEPIIRISTGNLAKGVYIIRVSMGTHWKTKKLIVH